MLRTTTLTPMAHLICVAHSRLELAEILVELRRGGVENLMALGGDPPTDPDAAEGELRHALELVELARAIGGFSIGVAAHPAGHPRSPDLAADRDHLAAKLRLADFAATQFFYRAEEYIGLLDDLAARGVDKPVLPGIMPVTSLAGIPRMAAMGAPVPPDIVAVLESAAPGGPEAVRRAGIELATKLCQELLERGAPGLHFYTLNRSSATRQIYANLGLGPAID
jgi:methylenetetrahydrofolate reductase (NADPH)